MHYLSGRKAAARRQAEKQALPTGQQRHLVVWGLCWLQTVFLAVKTRTMDPTPPAARAWEEKYGNEQWVKEILLGPENLLHWITAT